MNKTHKNMEIRDKAKKTKYGKEYEKKLKNGWEYILKGIKINAIQLFVTV